MANPIKLIKGVSKTMRGKKNSKGIKIPNSGIGNHITEGRYKANMTAAMAKNVPAQGNSKSIKGSNRTLKKAIKKAEKNNG